jgi:hypothetical protein
MQNNVKKAKLYHFFDPAVWENEQSTASVRILSDMVRMWTHQEESKTRFLTFNIKCAEKKDESETSWNFRKLSIAWLLGRLECDVIGLQEAYRHQITDILKLLPERKYEYVGESKCKRGGEWNPILYNAAKLVHIKSGTLWLNENMERYQKGSICKLEICFSFHSSNFRMGCKIC